MRSESHDRIVVLEDVTKRYPAAIEVPALRKANFAIDRGDYVAITGRSGSGKSTLLNILGLLDVPTGGRYWLNGRNVASSSELENTRTRAEVVGFVFQSFHLLRDRTVRENVQLGLTYRRTPRRVRVPLADGALERVGLTHRADALASTLSGGEAQRTAIARAIVGAPDILLCDEPTGNLDSSNTSAILELFRELHQVHGLTLVVVTHDSLVAREADRLLEVRDGVVLEHTSAEAALQ